MEIIKRSLYKILPLNVYLFILHIGFRLAYNLGLLYNNPVYKNHYFVKNLIKKDNEILDIGANLGYYTYIFSRLINNNGKINSVEPVKIYFNILKTFFNKNKKIKLYNYALGEKDETIEISLPVSGSLFQSGRFSIGAEGQKTNTIDFQVDMVRGSELFANEPKIDFIKCDIEGYEKYVLPEMKELINKHKPMILVEVSGDSREILYSLFDELGYNEFSVNNHHQLIKGPDKQGDSLFIQKDKQDEILSELKAKNLYLD